MPWEDGLVRVASERTAPSKKLGQALVLQSADVKCKTAVICPGVDLPGANADFAHPGSAIDVLLKSLLDLVPMEQKDVGRDLVEQLQNALRLTSGRQSRRKGGWEYAHEFLLDAVLLAEKLRPIFHAGKHNVMEEAVQQMQATT